MSDRAASEDIASIDLAIGSAVRDLRENRGLTARELAAANPPQGPRAGRGGRAQVGGAVEALRPFRRPLDQRQQQLLRLHDAHQARRGHRQVQGLLQARPDVAQHRRQLDVFRQGLAGAGGQRMVPGSPLPQKYRARRHRRPASLAPNMRDCPTPQTKLAAAASLAAAGAAGVRRRWRGHEEGGAELARRRPRHLRLVFDGARVEGERERGRGAVIFASWGLGHITTFKLFLFSRHGDGVGPSAPTKRRELCSPALPGAGRPTG